MLEWTLYQNRPRHNNALLAPARTFKYLAALLEVGPPGRVPGM